MNNAANIPLPLAAWLAHDSYDYVNDDDYISATSLLNPVGLSILQHRARQSGLLPEADVSDSVITKSGTAVHDQIEDFWRTPAKWEKALRKLGLSENFINSLLVDPDTPPPPGTPVMYMEMRRKRPFHGAVIGGKFDVVYCGQLMDYKQTYVSSYTSKAKDKIYQMQGSIYRWLFPDLITEDTMKILFMFKDWNSNITSEGYPIAPAAYKEYPLLSHEEVEDFIRKKLDALYKYRDVPTLELPKPEFDSLYQPDISYKYYADPTKTGGRATKVFDKPGPANMYAVGKPGVVIPVRSTNYEDKQYAQLKEILCMPYPQG